MATEAQKKAKEKYRKKSVKSILVSFYPKDEDLYEKTLEKGKSRGSTTEYIKELLKKDFEKS